MPASYLLTVSNNSRSVRSGLKNLIGVVATPLLAIACIVTIDSVAPAEDRIFSRCDQLAHERGVEYSGVSTGVARSAPGFRCVFHAPGDGPSTVVEEQRWLQWFVHLGVVAGSIAVLWWLLSSLVFLSIVGLGTALYFVVTSLLLVEGLTVTFLAGVIATPLGATAVVIRWKQMRAER